MLNIVPPSLRYGTLSLRRGQGEVTFGINIKGLSTQATIEEAKLPANEYLYNGNPDSYSESQDA